MFTKDEIKFLKDLVEPINNRLTNLEEGQKTLAQAEPINNRFANLEEGQKTLAQAEPINNRFANLEEGQKILIREVLHIKTAMKTFATKEDIEIAIEKSKGDIMKKMATKQDLEEAKIEIKVDIQNLDAKFANKLQNHEKSIKVLHESTNTADPNKH